MDMAFEYASKPQKASDAKIDALQIMIEKQTKTATEQIELLRESLKVSKSNEAHYTAQLDKAHRQNLAYDLISKVEKLYAKDQGKSLTLKEGCYLSDAYKLTDVETVLTLPLPENTVGSNLW